VDLRISSPPQTNKCINSNFSRSVCMGGALSGYFSEFSDQSVLYLGRTAPS